MAATKGTGIDALIVIGGATEAVIAARALKCVGGDIQCRFWPQNDEERRIAAEKGINLAKVHGCDVLVRGDNTADRDAIALRHLSADRRDPPPE